MGFQFSKSKVLAARGLEFFFASLTWVFFKKTPSPVRRILIVEPYYLGDVANLAVMFEPLLDNFPNCEIHLLVSTKFTGLFAEDSRIACIHGCDIPWAAYDNKYRFKRFRLGELFRLFRRLRKLDFDIGFDVRGEVRNQLLLLLSGCKRRVGSTNYLCSNLKIRGWLLTDSVGCLVPAHITKLHLKLCEAVGCNVSQSFSFPILQPSRSRKAGISGKTVVHVGGGSKFKKWKQSGWIEVCEKLDNVMLLGAPGDLEILEDMRGVVQGSLEIRITTSLQELINILFEARLYIGLDSGPANIASLVGCPSIILFGPGVVTLYRPLLPESIVLHHQELFPCSPCSQQTCVHPLATCTESIDVAEVLRSAGRILSVT